MSLPAKPLPEHVLQCAWLDRAELTRIEKLAEAHWTGLVPNTPSPSVEHADHRRVAARAVHATLLVASGGRRCARWIEQVYAFLRAKVAVFERVEPQAFTGCAPVNCSFLDVHGAHRRAALGTLDLHECPHASRGYCKDDQRL